MADELILSSKLIQKMTEHATNCLPEEACGLLAGAGTRVYEVIPVENIEHSPVRYRMKPQDQLSALLYIDENSWDLLGIYHSHPGGPETPSETDIEEAFYPESIYVIISKSNDKWTIRGFTIQERKPIEITIHSDQTE